MDDVSAGGGPGEPGGDGGTATDGGSPPADGGGDAGTLTAADLAVMNRMAVARAAAFVRIAGTVLAVVGAVGLGGWLWLAVRYQQQAGLGFDGWPGGSGPSPVERVDQFVGTIYVGMEAALVVGIGLLARLGADYAVARTGGSLTGFQVGDVLPPEPAADADPD